MNRSFGIRLAASLGLAIALVLPSHAAQLNGFTLQNANHHLQVVMNTDGQQFYRIQKVSATQTRVILPKAQLPESFRGMGVPPLRQPRLGVTAVLKEISGGLQITLTGSHAPLMPIDVTVKTAIVTLPVQQTARAPKTAIASRSASQLKPQSALGLLHPPRQEIRDLFQQLRQSLPGNPASHQQISSSTAASPATPRSNNFVIHQSIGSSPIPLRDSAPPSSALPHTTLIATHSTNAVTPPVQTVSTVPAAKLSVKNAALLSKSSQTRHVTANPVDAASQPASKLTVAARSHPSHQAVITHASSQAQAGQHTVAIHAAAKPAKLALKPGSQSLGSHAKLHTKTHIAGNTKPASGYAMLAQAEVLKPITPVVKPHSNNRLAWEDAFPKPKTAAAVTKKPHHVLTLSPHPQAKQAQAPFHLPQPVIAVGLMAVLLGLGAWVLTRMRRVGPVSSPAQTADIAWQALQNSDIHAAGHKPIDKPEFEMQPTQIPTALNARPAQPTAAGTISMTRSLQPALQPALQPGMTYLFQPAQTLSDAVRNGLASVRACHPLGS